MNYENQLDLLRKDLDKAKELKYRAEARMEQLLNQEKELVAKLKELNIEPENLESEIKKLEEEISSLLKQANDMMPRDILEGK